MHRVSHELPVLDLPLLDWGYALMQDMRSAGRDPSASGATDYKTIPSHLLSEMEHAKNPYHYPWATTLFSRQTLVFAPFHD